MPLTTDAPLPLLVTLLMLDVDPNKIVKYCPLVGDAGNLIVKTNRLLVVCNSKIEVVEFAVTL